MVERPSGGSGPGPASGPEGGLAALVRAAAQEGVAIDRSAARDGVLTLEVRRGPGGTPVTVDVLPRKPSERYHAATARHGLRHHGRAGLEPDQQAALDGIARALGSVEDRLPSWPPAPATTAGAGADAPTFTVERGRSVRGEGEWSEILVRLTDRCNQACPFCSGPPPHPDADRSRLRDWLARELPRHPRPTVTLTGGEPTLWRGLPELVLFLLERPEVVEVRVQTNAVAFAKRAGAAAYPSTPRLRFFVSFHAARPDIYDLCTATTGQFELAVAGIRALLAAGHGLTLNVVANRHNADHLKEWVAAVAGLFGPRPPRLHFSITMCPEHRPGAEAWLVPYSELAPRLVAAAREARRLGLECDPLLASSHAAIPPCLVPESERGRGVHADGSDAVPVLGPEETSVDGLRPWVKAPACERCAETRYCLGLPRPYAKRFGLSELRPIR